MEQMESIFIEKYKNIPAAASHADEPARDCYRNIYHMHFHKEMEMLSVGKDGVEFLVGGHTVSPKTGDIVMIPPYTPHATYARAGEPVQYTCIIFDLALLNRNDLRESMENGWCSLPLLLASEGNQAIYESIDRIFHEIMHQTPGWDLIVRGSLCTMFGDLIRRRILLPNLPRGNSEAPVSNKLFTKNHHDFCRRITEYLNAELANEISSRDTAERFHYNHSYFCRIFKESFGMSFHSYLSRLRIGHAKQLMAEGYSTADAARLSGFSNPSLFTQHFKKETGCLPKDFLSALKDGSAGSYTLYKA